MFQKMIIASILTVFTVSSAVASGGDASHMDNSFYAALINFAILATLLFILLRKSMGTFFRKRSTDTKIALDKAKDFYSSAYRKYEEIEAKLKNADVEGKKLLDSIRQEAEMEKQRIIRQARETAHNIKFDAERIIDQEVQKAKASLKSETAQLAAQLATKEIESKITADDHNSIHGDFFAELKNLKKKVS